MRLDKLQKKDYGKAIDFAVKGMHFDWYLNDGLLLALYGKYFLYMELCRATQVIAAYEGNTLTGILLADFKGEKKVCFSFWKNLYVKFFGTLQNIFAKGSADVYDMANKEMFSEYSEKNSPDGEIIFLAADQNAKAKGIGTALLNELERREQGKNVYLYTDSGCTYQFYEHRGFTLSGERNITLEIGGKSVPLVCMFFTKQIKN